MAVDEAQKLDAEYDSDDESSPDLEWMLGFAEEPAQRSSLLRHQFPSKVGGAPAWLDPVDLPHEDQLICGVSGLPLDFLCQLYAPVDTPSATAFHRTILLFISPKGSKLHLPGTVRAFRCQLPRANPFYSFEPPEEDSSPPALTLEQQTELGSRDRWASPQAATRVYKELHLDVEPAEDGYEEDDEGDQGPEKLSNVEERTAKLLREYQDREASEGAHSSRDLQDVEELVNEGMTPERKHMAMFCAEIMKNPEQCVRYCFDEGARPLTPSAEPRPPSDAEVPPCPRCGSPRRFEFQILPQLLHYMDLDDSQSEVADWGTIAVYSCTGSCTAAEAAPGSITGSSAYSEEYVWVQPPADQSEGNI